ncbi:hypothetical protein ACJX0J_009771, partial [Zea mays]
MESDNGLSLLLFIRMVVHGYSVKTGLIGETSLANSLLDIYSEAWVKKIHVLRAHLLLLATFWHILLKILLQALATKCISIYINTTNESTSWIIVFMCIMWLALLIVIIHCMCATMGQNTLCHIIIL